MDPANDKPDVLEKIDALLTRHRTGAPPQQEFASAAEQADRAAIPILTDIVAEPDFTADAIPVLTDAVVISNPELPANVSEPQTGGHGKITPNVIPAPPDTHASAGAPANAPAPGIALDEEALCRMEEFLVQELENRIALEFTASLDRALSELLDRSREHIQHVVHEALRQQLGARPPDDGNAPDQP